jgi:hypothetical protein
MTLAAVCQEIVWIRKILTAMGLEMRTPTTTYEYNQGTIAISKNPAELVQSMEKRIILECAIILFAKKLQAEQYLETDKMASEATSYTITYGFQSQQLRI